MNCFIILTLMTVKLVLVHNDANSFSRFKINACSRQTEIASGKLFSDLLARRASK